MAAILELRVIEMVYEDGLRWPDSDNEYITNTAERVITVMFIEAFRSAFGNNNANVTNLLNAAIASANQQYAAVQYLSLNWLMAEFARLAQDVNLNPAGVIFHPLPALPAHATPRDRFVWDLRYRYQGLFRWAPGTQGVFRQWIQGAHPENVDLPPTTVMNCWELVFYVAIKAGYLEAAPIRTVYASNADPGSVLFQAIDAYSRSKAAGGVQKGDFGSANPQANLRVGDILILPDAAGAGADLLNHVAAVVELGADTRLTKVIELWRHKPGSRFPQSDPNWENTLAHMTRLSTLSQMYSPFTNTYYYASLAP